jgi:hypothetical protein
MLIFEEELAKFQPSTEIDQAEDVNRTDTRDLTDLMMELIKDKES